MHNPISNIHTKEKLISFSIDISFLETKYPKDDSRLRLAIKIIKAYRLMR
jgi:hypothetical protein